VLIVVATIVLGSDAFMCSSLKNHKIPLKLKMAAVIASDKKMSVGIVGATGNPHLFVHITSYSSLFSYSLTHSLTYSITHLLTHSPIN
jgi:hypothetical protein